MWPVFVLFGQPNVGKSTLFNRLIGSPRAIVSSHAGTTRDRQIEKGCFGDRPFTLVDTGGVGETECLLQSAVLEQCAFALETADVIFFVVDARYGVTPLDQDLARKLRPYHKPVVLVVNKRDGVDPTTLGEFASLGFDLICPISAIHNQGIENLLSQAFEQYQQNTLNIVEASYPAESSPDFIPQLAVIGKPNAGKSTFLNTVLGEKRLLVSDLPGTTRDKICVPVTWQGKSYLFWDTAGIRKKSRVTEEREYLSTMQAFQAIREVQILLYLIDAKEGLSDQDLTLIEKGLSAGRSMIIGLNKWDSITTSEQEALQNTLAYRLRFASFIPRKPLSGLQGKGLRTLFKTLNRMIHSIKKPASSHDLTKILENALLAHPPLIGRRGRVKLRYAHWGSQYPFSIIIHGNQTDALPENYRRYLEKCFREALGFIGTPISVVFKTGENPFSGKRNQLTPRQWQKRRRLMQHVKKNK